MGSSMDNDTRGWIMCVISGIACVAGASIICVDYLVRLIPSKKDFRIQDSNIFLASSLSLSFGVMLFSALYSMLPSSKMYLIKSGYTPSEAAWFLLLGFMIGFVGIQVISRFLHHYIPSHVVDCDHNHEEETSHHSHDHSRTQSHGSHRHSHHFKTPTSNQMATESTPLLLAEEASNGKALHPPVENSMRRSSSGGCSRQATDSDHRRPSMIEVQKRVLSFVKDTKTNCDSTGPCFGYSDPCGQECFKHIATKTAPNSRHPTFLRTTTGSFFPQSSTISEEDDDEPPIRRSRATTRAHSRDPRDEACESESDTDTEDLEAQHHHHVPENAFMSIGLQTSIAIALHKLPEGFITYATNHANPSLGFSVFMALFIHNITEGFALALPLFLALHSKFRAMFWAAVLGGVSQPLGAGIAAAWFKIAGNKGHKPGEAAYGVMFAITAGIMASVALHLFVESLSLTHNRQLCVAFGFVGMAIMGMSNALTS
ncbi:Zinc-regulated transporter [Lachnellula willkommii]|uniref:Zinc-regulated transporter n=1 Tax=Lachnellula willkommii TaxID=215461 RepID=A0A559LZZ2_9HELO|nr:Zinc-regulated transporter [Lachnellula willkommii]